MPRLLVVTDVADRLNVSIKSVRRWITCNELHSHRFRQVVRVSEDDLAAFISKNRS